MRRLLTNPGDYIWQLAYGAGLGGFVGQPGAELRLRALIRSQVFKESGVARTPEPAIAVQVAPGGARGVVLASVRYQDAVSGQPQILSLSVSG